ncbi:hypothetical protein MLD38_008194 [Melastoma candidum]|uniref:Uncharacterized protein n=1 Tax=Melastoma candidum TaxID=119954 RepID=A0ACB9RTG7_9MYRT|nr:hypothetical protein MLD38_008194 [Melastoma candidum]
MSDDLLLHLSSNSSNQSDQSLPTKMAKLEARLVGKAASSSSAPAMPLLLQQQAARPSAPPALASRFTEEMAKVAMAESSSSDSDDDIAGEYLIQANTQKRPRVQVDEASSILDHVEATSDGLAKMVEAIETRANNEVTMKRQGRGRSQSGSARSRGSKINEMKSPNSMSIVSQPNGQLESSSYKDNRPKEQSPNENHSLEDEISALRSKVVVLEEDLHKARQESTDYQNLYRQSEKEFKELKDHEQQMKPKISKIISDLLISVSKAERHEARMKVRQDSLRLGNVGVMRAGTVISETWEDGQAMKDLNSQLKQLLENKEAIERQRKSLKKRQNDKGEGADGENGLLDDDILIQDEIYKSRISSIKREEESILRERDRYEFEKGRLIREMKRIRDEDGSRFNNFQILNHRYALLNLLGKGGFSEVYKAYDLVDHRYVACKLHGLNAQWSEEKKQSYIRHAIREYNIHKSLVHHHIVRLWDIFEIDHNTFCTILEFCSGKDLDAVLKATPLLPEKEAKIILVQIFQGLVYLNKRAQKIIHYDLKPGNVLFDEFGVAKVTDFGLSKIVEENVGSQGMELTSQGAGTYWYLPPECFDLSKIPLISSKVDVWSAGVLFYQMLFGKRPFGHDQTQERILREDTIIKARKVEFPTRPAVSSEAKELIRRCLTYDQAERPDVLTIAKDPYLTYTKK